MMQYASQGLRNAARKGSNTLVHGGHNGPGGGTASNTQTRSIHLFSPIRSGQAALHAPPPLPSGPTAPRNPTNRLFSISRNLLQNFFTHLTAPGLKAPTHLPIGSRSLHSSVLRTSTIQSRLSTAARYSLRNNALQRQANTFLPRGPGPAPPPFGGVTQVGLGMARNFSTGRPIFQHLAENVPVAVRALYEADLDLELKRRHERKRLVTPNAVEKVKKTKEMIKPLQKSPKREVLANVEHGKLAELHEETEHYFPAISVAPITTYLLIPLAPTPTSRTPLPPDPLPSRPGPSQEPRLLPPLSYVGSLHASHTIHSLRVSTLFTRLDQANVWARGVQCSAYSQGHAHRKRRRAGENDASDEGACTILKVEFVGWSKAEVRSVIGESGSGWCVLEEVLHEEDEGLTDMESLSSEPSEEDQSSHQSFGLGVLGGSGMEMIDPSESFILPTLDFSSSFISSSRSSSSLSHNSPSNDPFVTIPSEMENDPWVDDYYDSSSSQSSDSECSELIIDPPSSNGWFGSGHGLGPGVGFSSQFERMRDEVEPREVMFN
ncbi:hypothetical protein BYT27DRAFT_7186939 [Phlegmacium glaucopus]|nr:hypothetical protein BYT27DRAFT_7186939 [Phlegmacium glaucopus]